MAGSIAELQNELLAIRSTQELKSTLFQVEFAIREVDAGALVQSRRTRVQNFEGIQLRPALLYQGRDRQWHPRMTPKEAEDARRKGYAVEPLIGYNWKDIVGYTRLYGAEESPESGTKPVTTQPKKPGRPAKAATNELGVE